MYESVMESNPSYGNGKDIPVERVSWYDAVYFCNKMSELHGKEPVYDVDGEVDVTKWGYTTHKGKVIQGEITQNTSATGYRLPTYDEWTYAAKGGEDYKYAGSDNIDEVAWYSDNSGMFPHTVAQKKVNGYGLYDMSGNVWEWIWDPSSDDAWHYVCGGSYCNDDYYSEVESKYNSYADNCYHSLVCFRLVCKFSSLE